MSDTGSDEIKFYTDNIRTFVAVAEYGGLGRAARALGLSQPSVSQQVSRLESLIGRKLFDRGPYGVTLTGEGEILRRHAQSMIDISDLVNRDFGINRRKVKLRVGLSEMFGVSKIHRVLWLLARQNPGLSLRIVLGRGETLSRGFQDGEFDVIVTWLFAPPPNAELLRSEPLVWIGRPDATDPAPEPVPLILPLAPSLLRDAMLSSLTQAGRSWTSSFEVSSVSVAEAAIEAGFGFCAALASMPLSESIQLDRRAGLPQLGQLEYYICSRQTPDQLISAFCSLIKEAAK